MRMLRLLDRPGIYSLWQAPFVAQKLRPFRARRPHGFLPDESVIELGCGPGTNAGSLGSTRYQGWDLSPEYIEAARSRLPLLQFGVADVTTDAWVPTHGPVQAIFMNSLLHHLDDSQVELVFSNIKRALAQGGEIHIMDLVLPETLSIPRALARADRGNFARTLSHWRALFDAHFQTLDFEPYPLGFLGVTLWSMVYWRGAPRA